MPSDRAFKTMNRVHRIVLRLTGWRVAGNVSGMPMLELVTTGRRSGRPRTVLLSSPVRVDGAYVVVASRGGDDRHPAWFHNLTAQPRVEVSVRGGPRRTMRARVATSEERDRLWPRVVARFAQYGSYQERTQREIPLVLLEPTP